jgi:hypothetical protein
MYSKQDFKSNSSIPEFLIFPPNEEFTTSDPCLSWFPETKIFGISNENFDCLTSCVNAMIQIFASLPEIHNELPLDHQDEITTIFTRLIHGLHMEKQMPQINEESSDFETCLRIFRSRFEDHLKKDVSANSENTDLREEIVESIFVKNGLECNILSDAGMVDSDCANTKNRMATLFNYEKVFKLFHYKVIQNTRFGSRFILGPSFYEFCIKIDVYKFEKRTNLMEALNGMYGLPSLFFGGRPPLKMKKIPFIERLPSFLTIFFDRLTPVDCSNRFMISGICMELPLEMDVGKFLASNCIKPFASYGYSGSPTFCRLHGFMTQKDGQFIVYTRTRSGKDWFRICDSNVEKIVMGFSIESKGILLAIYRLQDIH